MNIAIIIAGGAGQRMRQDISKQFINVYDKPVLIYTFMQNFACNISAWTGCADICRDLYGLKAEVTIELVFCLRCWEWEKSIKRVGWYMNNVCIALNMCTYKREEYIRKNLEELKNSRFFNPEDKTYYGRLYIFIVDNASELTLSESLFICLIHNKNTGGSGGFQRGLDEIRASGTQFSHVVFMDDDVRFKADALYILYDFLCAVDKANQNRPVAGRMFDLDNPDIQWTAAEIWNAGNIDHVEFLRDISKPDKNGKQYEYGKVVYDCGADYGGWWFCCYPMRFAEKNDIMPFFLHCDDVEYGLRCGKPPIIIEGVQVWHETWEKRKLPHLLYYDTRNTLFVNEKYGLQPPASKVFWDWKKRISAYHAQRDWLSEYMVICGMGDFLRGMNWLEHLNSEMHHKRITRMKSSRIKNAVAWRWVAFKFKKKYKNNRGKYCKNG